MFDIQEKIQELTRSGVSVWVAGPAASSLIDKLEAEAGFSLPSSYKTFLSEVGAISVDGDTVAGIIAEEPLDVSPNSLLGATNRLRRELEAQYEVPNYLWVINAHEDGAFCFNTRIKTKNGELAIVNYEPYLAEASFDEVLAESFEEFLERWFFAAYLDEDQQDLEQYEE